MGFTDFQAYNNAVFSQNGILTVEIELMHLIKKPNVIHLLYVLLIVVVIVQTACAEDDSQKSKKRQANIPLVEVYKTRLQAVSYQTTRTGTLIPRKILNIHNQEEGLILALPFYEGDQIRPGDKLVKIEQSLLVPQLSKASAQRKQAKQNYDRIKRLFKNRLISEDQLVNARTDYEVAQADEKHLQTRLNHMVISAPFAGVVTLRNKEPGDVVPKFTHLLTIIDPASLIIQVRLSALLIPRYAKGDRVKVLIDALGKKPFNGVIDRIHPTIDTDTRQGTLEVKLSPLPQGAKVGQLCRVTLSTTLEASLMIPFNALQRDKTGEYVYIVENDKAKRINVRSGLRQGKYVNIVAGLEQGMAVITKGFVQIKPGRRVDNVSKPDKRSNSQQPTVVRH